MTRQISKGVCTFCHIELSKASMTRHLASCEKRTATQGERESRQKAQKTRAFHLIVEGYATGLYTQCIYEDKGCLCDACAKSHECGEEMLLPLVNSPRAGVCGYTGQDPASIW